MPVYLSLFLFLCFNACGLLTDNDQDHLLTVKPVSAVEAALEIETYPGSEITIYRDDAEVFTFHLARRDTIVYDAGLEPATSYRWRITSRHPVTSRVQISEQQATTLDTTSSNFTWQTFSFGEHSSSVLYGVSIIDENNIWAVGEIHMNDSTGQADSRIYNAVHWDGNSWKLKRITVDFRGNLITPPLNAIHSFSASDIWLSSGVPIHGDGTNWTQFHLFDMNVLDDTDGGIKSIWGKDNEIVFFGGALGSFAHYDGQSWQKIETNTELDFYDIHGNPEQGVVAVAAKRSESRDKMILRIKENLNTKSLPTAPIPFSISGIWFNETGVSYLVGSGLFLKSKLDSPSPWKPIHQNITPYYLEAIDANGLNDIVTVGAFGEFLHFNGTKWTSFQSLFDGNLLADVAIQENITVAVGFEGRQAFITIGKRE